MTKLQDKVAIITGATGGIGFETARLFLEHGAKLALVDLKEEDLKEAAESLDAGDRILTIVADVSKEDEVKNYVSETINAFGRIDILFNNAGISGGMDKLIDVDVDKFESVLSVNTTGVFLGMKHVLPQMYKQESGSVINTSSVGGLIGFPGLTTYGASKHAVVGLTKTAALESAEKRVRVNSIHPGPVGESMVKNLEQGTDANLSDLIPLGYVGSNLDVAKLVLFLASDDSEYITGVQYRIDGGMGAK